MYKFNDAKEFQSAFLNNGIVATEDGVAKLKWEDAMSYPDAPQYFKVTVENVIREAIEPLMIGTRLLQRIQYQPGTQISYGAIGVFEAADIPEGQEYPEMQPNIGSGAMITTIGKSGVACKITEEMRRYSQWDMIATCIKLMGKALVRHKEKKIFNMLSNLGVVTHDNVTPANSIYGVTGGRSLDGTGNGSVIVDNIYQAYNQLVMNGYNPDIMLVHPLTFTAFIMDPVMRAFALQNGGGAWFQGYNGNPGSGAPWSGGILGNAGPSGQAYITPRTENNAAGDASALSQYSQTINSAFKLPSYLGLPLSVVVSPFVPYNPQTRLTNLILADSSNIGALIVDEDPTMDEVEDKLRDLKKIKVRERYALLPFDEGNAVAIMKNIKIVPNQLVLPVQATGIAVSSELDATTAIYDADGEAIIPPVTP